MPSIQNTILYLMLPINQYLPSNLNLSKLPMGYEYIIYPSMSGQNILMVMFFFFYIHTYICSAQLVKQQKLFVC